MAVIEVSEVWKQYQSQIYRPRTLKEKAVELFLGGGAHGRSDEDVYWALRDVSLEIERGETFAIIGDNGSGKSTLLKLITGIIRPTRGNIQVNGRISALLELGAGFHPDFTGRENIFLNGAILGLRKSEIARYFDSIVAFSELEPFIDAPVKTYSSGMYMRLAFSIAVHVDPDILLVDEILAVGDAAFQQKCLDQINRFKHMGKTIVYVSHSLGTVRDLCQRAAWLDKGNLRALGGTESVLDFYSQKVATSIEKNKQEHERLIPTGDALIRGIQSLDAEGNASSIFAHGEAAQFRFALDLRLPLEEVSIMARIFRTDGICCYDGRAPLRSFMEPGDSADVRLCIPELRLNHGTYYLQLNLLTKEGGVSLDEKFFNFAVDSSHRGPGIAPLEASWNHVSALASASD